MTVVIVQCRLSSTRLPGKGLKDLGGKSVLAWTLAAMKKVNADAYYVATDNASFSALAPVARQCGFECFAGPLEDVLHRFCMVIEKTGADIVVRATADNPFLFYEAAQTLLEEYEKRITYSKCDYITWTGLPHGSGIEIFNGQALLKAEKLTAAPYDHEHVGPALYNHTDTFSALMLKAPARFNHSEMRTTIDTPSDYRKACKIVKYLSDGNAPAEPYTTEQILSAFSEPSIAYPVLYVPSVKKGQGTGHLRRCLSAAAETGEYIYIPENAGIPGIPELAAQYSLESWQTVKEFPEKGEYALIAADCFSLDRETAQKLYECAPLAAIDEGSSHTQFCDYLLDVIPSIVQNRQANRTDASFMEMPKNRRSGHPSQFKKILVVAGGEDPAGMVIPAAAAFSGAGRHVSAIPGAGAVIPESTDSVTWLAPVPGLKEHLAEYDLVVTHYGLTAYEAAAAGCAVILFATTPLHARLAAKYGFVCLGRNELTPQKVKQCLSHPEKLYSAAVTQESSSFGGFVSTLARGKRFACPVCGKFNSAADKIIARTPVRTFRRCASCGMVYMSWTADGSIKQYTKDYFSEQYKNQYGRTYLEDFESIKQQCSRRIADMDMIYRLKLHGIQNPSVLDVGCAYGPFLAAANENGWQVFGTDIAEDAVTYVQQKLLFPAAVSAFPDFDAAAEFGIQRFDAVTMWFVIEHFRNLDEVLKKVSSLVKEGGIFAFSTPSGEGVSAHRNRDSFFDRSPSDHYTIWEPSRMEKILGRYGFKVVKTVSTGHHPERFPQVARHGWKKGSLLYSFYDFASRVFRMGDTFEVYCRKTGAADNGK